MKKFPKAALILWIVAALFFLTSFSFIPKGQIGEFFTAIAISVGLGFWGWRVKKEPLKREYKEEVFFAVGVSYYIDDINKLATCNPDWKKTAKGLLSNGKGGRRIFRYNYINKPVKLVPEPTNEHDKNAIIVQIAGEKVGYIAQSENVRMKDILSKHDVKFISSFISGGQYKEISPDGTIQRFEDNIDVKIKIGYV